MWHYEPFLDDVRGLNVGAESTAQTTLSGSLAMVMARVKPIARNYAMFESPIVTNAVKTAQIHGWWFQEIARIVPAPRNFDPPHANNSVVNESSEQLFSLLTSCTRL